MTRPLAYAPEYGYEYQLLYKTSENRAYEHCDYAVDREDLKHLLNEYRLAFGSGFTFKYILLPQKYWKKVD